MVDNSLSPRAQPEDEDYFLHNIRGNTLQLFYFLPTDFNASALWTYTMHPNISQGHLFRKI